jgi:hypothetical protein
MNFSNTKDQSLLHFYESVRRQVESDIQSGGAIVLPVIQPSNMPIDLARKWIGGVCDLRRSIGIDNAT